MVIVLHLYIVNDLLGLPGRVCRNIPSIVRWVISCVFSPTFAVIRITQPHSGQFGEKENSVTKVMYEVIEKGG